MTELEEFVKDLDTSIKKLEDKKEEKSIEQTFDEQVFGKRDV